MLTIQVDQNSKLKTFFQYKTIIDNFFSNFELMRQKPSVCLKIHQKIPFEMSKIVRSKKPTRAQTVCHFFRILKLF